MPRILSLMAVALILALGVAACTEEEEEGATGPTATAARTATQAATKTPQETPTPAGTKTPQATATPLPPTPTPLPPTPTPPPATPTSPPPTPTLPPPTPTQAPSVNCHPSYPDVCIPIGSADYDCAGGSGNGPNYISGPIRVLPPDPYDLDRDGNGWGCE
jgi:outer membrane biosynthesis protein TonB